MNLLTKEQTRQLIANGARANRERMGEVTEDLTRMPVVKLFTPWGSATWLLSEIDPEAPDVAFGLCDLGVGSPELGCVSLTELAGVKGPLGLGVERDLYWTPEKSLVAYAEDARLHNAIQA